MGFDTSFTSAQLILALGGVIATAAVVATLCVRHQVRAVRLQHEEIERQRAELARRFAVVMQRADEGVLIIDDDLRIIEINNRALELYGATRDDLLGRTVPELRSGHTREEFEQIVRAVEGVEHAVYESVHRRLDGSEFPVEISATALRLDGGVNRIALVRDITARKLTESALRESEEKYRRTAEELEAERNSLATRVVERTADLTRVNEDLERALRTKDEFLATMSHELRTPLNAILALSETLLEQIRGPLNERQQASVRTIESSGRHLLALITDILDLSKIETGKLEIAVEPVSLAQLGESCLSFVRESATKKNIRLDYRISDSRVTVDADPMRLKQMVINLLSNAVKFTGEGGEVGLDIEVDGATGEARIAVRDTGIGIAPEDQARLFKPFVQLDSGLSRKYEGTGLGLALVRRLAELHGGTVTVSSQLGQGSRFTIVLPRVERSSAGATPASAELPALKPLVAEPDQNGAKVRVLLADDGESNIIAIGDYLIDVGYDVVVARNGIEAIELASQTTPAVILMDVQMPEMDGLEATRRLRADPEFAKVPIIALTGLAMAGDRERCLAAGATDYLAKPVSPRVLVETIRRYTAE